MEGEDWKGRRIETALLFLPRQYYGLIGTTNGPDSTNVNQPMVTTMTKQPREGY